MWVELLTHRINNKWKSNLINEHALNREPVPLRFEDQDDYKYEIVTSGFFASSQNIDSPESFILPFFTRIVNTVIFSKGGYALSRTQNDRRLTFDDLFPSLRHSR